ncbi:hypothetical protein BZA05DRAFT_169055 [Tricharina praecox]|uniref:uncharacterized protein n=1 Tax=Tricharina praecox TaxID=43433 RepID=UPI0022203B03|nr:uncharacterized protein BZA05DRAFT_169055 [Tricharina praecox]KAI5857229.1 hypothetical protein BZA05DRAFT_169055 [Tricharina praecox]
MCARPLFVSVCVRPTRPTRHTPTDRVRGPSVCPSAFLAVCPLAAAAAVAAAQPSRRGRVGSRASKQRSESKQSEKTAATATASKRSGKAAAANKRSGKAAAAAAAAAAATDQPSNQPAEAIDQSRKQRAYEHSGVDTVSVHSACCPSARSTGG